MSAPSGKKGVCGACGGPATYVFPSFATCDARCEFEDDQSDGVPEYVDPERTKALCKHCGSDYVEQWDLMFAMNGVPLWQCHSCGKSFHA